MKLKQAEFSNIVRCKFGCSNDEIITNLEQHADVEWMRNAFQLVVEAEKL